MLASKRSTGKPYLPAKAVSTLCEEYRMISKKSKKMNSSKQGENQDSNDQYDDELSMDIALAVAIIVAESEMFQSDTSNKDDEVELINENSRVSSASQAATNTSSKSKISEKHASNIFQKIKKNPPKTGSMCSTEESVPNPAACALSIPMPSRAAKMGSSVELMRYLGRVQNLMNKLGYHREGEPEIKINPRLSMKMQIITAKDIIRAALPIKCLHAVVLAVHFTNCIDSVERFPIYFRSHVSGKEYKHIVLGIYLQGHFGALGISRDPGLQDKKTVYTKLTDLVCEFADCYGNSGHVLNEIKFGNIITHDPSSIEKLFSKIGSVTIHGCTRADIEVNVEKFAKQLRAKMGLPCLKSLRLDSSQHQQSLTRLTRSKTNLNNSACGRARALSMGPSSNCSNGNSEESVGKSGIRTKPPKSKRK